MSVKVRERPRRSGVWWVFIDHNGRRKAKRIGKDKRLAQEVARKIEAKLLLGEMQLESDSDPPPTFGDYADIFITSTAPATCKQSTVGNHRRALRNHVLPVFGAMPVSDINRLKIKRFLTGKLKTGLSKSTVHNLKCTISAILNLAVDDETIPVNPAHKLGRFAGNQSLATSGNKSGIEPLSPEEVDHLLATCEMHFPTSYPILLTLVRSGMRVGEVMALKWGDIDFHGRFILLQRNYVKGRLDTPKNGKCRHVDMSLQLAETLWRLKHERETQFKGKKMPEWVFLNEQYNIVDTDNWRTRVFYKLLDKAEMRHIRIHDLRHTYASLLLASGANMMYVRDQLGHGSIRVTVDIYGHLMKSGDAKAVDVLDSLHKSSDITSEIRNLYATKNENGLSATSLSPEKIMVELARIELATS